MQTMRENIIVSNRGQITLPAALRKRTGIQPGSVVIVEEQNGGLMLRPAAVFEVESYSDAEIAQWDREDRLTPHEKTAILERLGN
jgi:AbrB family looped-hinge helix DNA binding protein